MRKIRKWGYTIEDKSIFIEGSEDRERQFYLEYGRQYVDGVSVGHHADDFNPHLGSERCGDFYDCLCKCKPVPDGWKVRDALLSDFGYEGTVFFCELSDVPCGVVAGDDGDGGIVYGLCSNE